VWPGAMMPGTLTLVQCTTYHTIRFPRLATFMYVPRSSFFPRNRPGLSRFFALSPPFRKTCRCRHFSVVFLLPAFHVSHYAFGWCSVVRWLKFLGGGAPRAASAGNPGRPVGTGSLVPPVWSILGVVSRFDCRGGTAARQPFRSSRPGARRRSMTKHPPDLIP
jgi:hypothetical protein